MINKLSKEQIIKQHKALIKQYGGIDGIRDIGLLESALATPFQAKASQLAYGIIKNHPFVDGNKRTGIHTMLLYLGINGVILDVTQQDLIDITILVADGSASRDDLLHWIISHEKW